MIEAPSNPRSSQTRQKLIDAAARVFARRGFDGATTREIAHEAAVNEVTLFRLFQTKENLQTTVLRCVFEQQAKFLAAQPKPAPSASLHTDLLRIAQSYQAALRQNISLVRALLGEMHRFAEHKQVLETIFEPLRAELIATLDAAHRANLLRPGVNPFIAVSMLPGAILSDLLKRSVAPPYTPPYPAEEHLAMMVDIFLHGIVAAPLPRSPELHS